MQQLANRIERFTRGVGLLTAWFTLLMVLVMSVVVIQRYLFDAGDIWLQESITFMHAAVFMLGAAYTLAENGHVRVDIFYSGFQPRGKAIVDLAGTCLLLLPFCAFLVWSSWDFVSTSWAVGEASPESGGLPFPFPAVVKSFIPVGAALLLLQGLVISLRALHTLRSGD